MIARVAMAAIVLAAGPVAGAEIIVSEGTNFAAALSSDGQRLVIDLQGALGFVPIGGGEARTLTDGADDDRLPSWGPEDRIVYQSFASGSWNLRLLEPGSTPVELTSGPQDDREPIWSTDGRRIVFASDRNGNFDVWAIDATTRELTQLTSDPADDYGPAVSSDGRSIAFLSDRGGGSALYIKTGDAAPRLIAELGAPNLAAPAFSPNDDMLALVTPDERLLFPTMALNRLVVYDIATGDRRMLSDSAEDVFAFAPQWVDDRRLIYTADGKIRRRDLDSAAFEDIPFTTRLSYQHVEYEKRLPVRVDDKSQPALGIVSPVEAPDGRGIAFGALGDLWLRQTDGNLEQLTADVFIERDMAFSPDGGLLAFISDRSGSTQVWVRDMETGDARQVTEATRGVRYPVFSPDGERLAYQQIGPSGVLDFTVHLQALTGGKPNRLRKAPRMWPGAMAWSADGEALIVSVMTPTSKRYRGGVNRLFRVAVDDSSVEALPLTTGMLPDAGVVAAPDGRALALPIGGVLHVVALTTGGRLDGSPQPVINELADDPGWSGDGRSITYLSNDGLTRVRRDGSKRETLPIRLRWAPDVPTGRTIVHAGRLFDGISDDYVTDVDIIIDGNRIVDIEKHRAHPVDDVRIFDASDQVVLPGLIDQHGHHQGAVGEWAGRSWLAFGVTTVAQPGGMPYLARAMAETWSLGTRPGPRLFFAGPQLDGAKKFFPFAAHITSDERLDWELERARRLEYSLIKTYVHMTNARQQRTIDGAHALGIPVTSHETYPALGRGADRVEHLRGGSRLDRSAKQSDLQKTYDDVISITAASGAAVTPTAVTNGGYFAYLLDHPELNDNPQYRVLYSDAYRQSREMLGRMATSNEPLLRAGFANAQQTIFEMYQAGVPIIAGTDATIFPYGMGLIVELENYRGAGLSAADTLKTATSAAAKAMGADDELGAIAPGRLADLVIVDGDPLAELSDLLNVAAVMKNGRYYRLEDLLKRPVPE